MCHAQLGDASLHRRLLAIDEDIASQARRGGCALCGEKLDQSSYPRKPRGAPEGLGPEYERRLSFCCRREGCRKRLTPPSVRFLGRRVWLGVVVTLACIATQGIAAHRARKLRDELGVDRRTLERWRRWWQDELPTTSFWGALKGRLREAIDVAALPRSLFDRLEGDAPERVIRLLRLLLPLSHSELMAGRCSMAR